ncbi:20229_t:CDS:2 [Dentiscutata erythropus]|uniref:20229_t:CDS:1 n=1 Tax=Dentiscutata erythropus TaxID=1348616 RepID=A0A9N9HYA4_9GLOM|nr:20229_t:CDS:2 [Dentiscutata erythropus]
MIKTRVITTFILFAFIFTYLQATALHVPRAFTIESSELGFVLNIDGEIKKGIGENTPDNYFIGFSELVEAKISFSNLGLAIEPPKAGPLSRKLPGAIGILNLIVNHNLTIFKGDEALDTGKIVEA